MLREETHFSIFSFFSFRFGCNKHVCGLMEHLTPGERVRMINSEVKKKVKKMGENSHKGYKLTKGQTGPNVYIQSYHIPSSIA